MKGKRKTPKVPGFMRSVLAENVRALMERQFALHSNRPRMLATAAGISLSTAQRVLSQETGATIDNIEAIAAVFDLAAYQLLIPGLEAANPQVVQGATATERRMYRRYQQARIPAPGTTPRKRLPAIEGEAE